MKTKLYLSLALLFTVVFASAQTYMGDNMPNSLDSFHSQDSQLNYLSSQSSVNNELSPVGNSLFITQTGDGNVINSNTVSQNSDIRLNQNGNDNNLDLKIRANTIVESVSQTGNGHNFVDYSTQGTNYHSGAVQQTGNNQNLSWYGNNSISEKLQVKMQGQLGQTVEVRNFN